MSSNPYKHLYSSLYTESQARNVGCHQCGRKPDGIRSFVNDVDDNNEPIGYTYQPGHMRCSKGWCCGNHGHETWDPDD